jgi:hypothetical protein
MKKLLLLTGSLLFASVISASAADTPTTNTTQPAMHSKESMTAGSHAMAGQKQHHMSDRVMPSQSRHCTEEALAKMPADHRAACGK